MLHLPLARKILLALLFAAAAAGAQAVPGSLAMAQTAVSAEVQALLDDRRPAAELSRKELAQRMRQLRRLIAQDGLAAGIKRQLRVKLAADRQYRRAGMTAANGGAAVEPGGNGRGAAPVRRPECRLKATPAAAKPGAPVKLSWTSEAGYSSGELRLGNAILSSAPQLPDGSLAVKAPQTPSRHSYILEISGAHGSSFCTGGLTVEWPEDVIFDLTPATLAPSETPKQITFISTQTDEQRGGLRSTSACVLTYRKKSGTVTTRWTVMRPEDLSRARLAEAAWRVVNHHGNTQLCFPQSAPAEVSADGTSVKVAAKGPEGGVAHELTFGDQGVAMRGRQTELATQFFGIPYFYKKSRSREDRIARKDIKLDQYLDRPFERRPIGEYSSLTFTLDVTPLALDYVVPGAAGEAPFVDRSRSNGKMVCVKGKPDKHAGLGQPCIEKDMAGANFRIANLDLQWRDPRCSSRNDPSQTFCQHVGGYIYFTISIAEARFEFIDDNPQFTPLIQDPESRGWIYRYSLKQLLPAGTTRNPFKIAGKRTVVSGELLQPMRQAIFAAERANPPGCSANPRECVIPPRLKTAQGAAESDAEYLQHFSIANGQVGFEVISLSDLTFRINRFALIGTRRGN